MDTHDIDQRLTDLEASLPVASARPPLAGSAGRRRRGLLPLAAGGVLVLALTGTAVAGAVVSGLNARGAPGVENPGQPLAGAGLECMSPPEAGRYLARHGFTDVVWQVESGGAGKGGSSRQQSEPPQHGYVVPGSILGDGKLYMVVDQRADASGVGACHGAPMP
jgi:hypothetical protein